MSLTIAKIAAKAVSAVQGAITDAVAVATITRPTQGAYTVATGAYAISKREQTGRAVLMTLTPNRAAMFAPYVAGPTDAMYMLEGFTDVKENDTTLIGGKTRVIMAVQDIGGAGSVWYIIAK